MKIVQLLLAAALLTPGWLKASSPKVDSLLHLLETHTALDRAEVLWAVAYELFDVDNPEAAFYAERAYHEVWQKGDSLQIVKIGTTHTQLQRRLGNLDHSIQLAIPLLHIAKRNVYRKYEKMLLNGLSVSHMEKGTYDKALKYSYESLTARREDGDSAEVGIALLNIGYIYYKLYDFKLAISFLFRSANLLQSDEGTKLVANMNIAAAYCDLKQYKLALEYYRGVVSGELKGSERALLASSYQGMAQCFLGQSELDSAYYYANSAIYEAKRMKNVWALTIGYLVLSRISLDRGDLSTCEEFIKKADAIHAAKNFPILGLEIKRHKVLLLVKPINGDNSLRLINSYLEERDSLFRGEADRRILAVQTMELQRESRMKLKAQADILDLQNQSLTRQRAFIVVISGLFTLVVILALELYRANRRKESINKLLDRRVIERTRELGHQRDVLQHFIDEEMVLKQRVIRDVLSQTNTLRGLIYLGKIDRGPNVEQYLSGANTLTYEIQNTVSKLGT